MNRRPLLFALLVVGLASLGATVSDLNEAGKSAYQRGHYAEAERLFREAIARAPSDPLLHYHRGVSLSRLSRWQEAAQSYEAALRLNPPPALATTIREALRSAASLIDLPAARNRPSDDSSVPLRRAAGGWLVDVLVNETRPARFLVDTGASICVIGPDLALELGIVAGPDARTINLQTLSGRTSGPLVTIRSVRVGDVELENVPAVIHDTGPRMDGILGNTFLGRFTVTVDPERSVLNLRPR